MAQLLCLIKCTVWLPGHLLFVLIEMYGLSAYEVTLGAVSYILVFDHASASAEIQNEQKEADSASMKFLSQYSMFCLYICPKEQKACFCRTIISMQKVSIISPDLPRKDPFS